MRLHLCISGKNEILPFNYQPILTRAIHKWLGENNEDHGKLSLYSFSWFQDVKALNDGILVNSKSNFFISAYDSAFLKKIILGIQYDNQITEYLSVNEIIVQEDPFFHGNSQMFLASPVFIKRFEQGNENHYTWQDSESDLLLTETLKRKLRLTGIPDNDVKVAFDRTYHSPKTKIIYYKHIGNKTSFCPVIISGTQEQIAFAWNVGIGNSTGIGFGALK
jgi:CRISPR-associated endoribonuclease Cas6